MLKILRVASLIPKIIIFDLKCSNGASKTERVIKHKYHILIPVITSMHRAASTVTLLLKQLEQKRTALNKKCFDQAETLKYQVKHLV